MDAGQPHIHCVLRITRCSAEHRTESHLWNLTRPSTGGPSTSCKTPKRDRTGCAAPNFAELLHYRAYPVSSAVWHPSNALAVTRMGPESNAERACFLQTCKNLGRLSAAFALVPADSTGYFLVQSSRLHWNRAHIAAPRRPFTPLPPPSEPSEAHRAQFLYPLRGRRRQCEAAAGAAHSCQVRIRARSNV